MITHDEGTTVLSIGELASRTGLSVLRIRAWEARHGIPVAIQAAPGGHRRYYMAEAMRLEMIAQAIDLGWRIGNLKGMSVDELRTLLSSPSAHHPSNPENSERSNLIQSIRAGDERALRRLLMEKRAGGYREELQQVWVPWLNWIGDAWESGELTIAEEHFASGILQAHLEMHWRHRNVTLKGRPFVLTLLDGDRHSMGLHLATIALVEAGVPVIWLGGYTPMASVLSAASEWNARGIAVSISISCPWSTSEEQLKFLQAQKPRDLELIVGGKGYHHPIRGVKTFATVEDLHDYLVP